MTEEEMITRLTHARKACDLLTAEVKRLRDELDAALDQIEILRRLAGPIQIAERIYSEERTLGPPAA